MRNIRKAISEIVEFIAVCFEIVTVILGIISLKQVIEVINYSLGSTESGLAIIGLVIIGGAATAIPYFIARSLRGIAKSFRPAVGANPD
jgi:hypothetical protein